MNTRRARLAGGLAAGRPSSDPAFVAPGAVPWLLLQRTEVQEEPGGGDRLTVTSFIRRLDTAGGLAPAAGCASQADLGAKVFVGYRADYFFCRGAGE